jgi:hypothetical protein
LPEKHVSGGIGQVISEMGDKEISPDQQKRLTTNKKKTGVG